MVEIDQAIGNDVRANRAADRGHAYAATRETYPGNAEPSGGIWHRGTDEGLIDVVIAAVGTAQTIGEL